MTIDQIIKRLKELSKWYQMMGDEVNVINEAVKHLQRLKELEDDGK